MNLKPPPIIKKFSLTVKLSPTDRFLVKEEFSLALKVPVIVVFLKKLLPETSIFLLRVTFSLKEAPAAVILPAKVPVPLD